MTGPAGDEPVEVLDEAGRVRGVVPRSEMRARRLRHRAVFVVVVGTDDRVLAHRRSLDKDLWPGRWDVAAGGVLAPGEDDEAGARRELAEELGIAGLALERLGDGAYRDDDVDVVGAVYLARSDGPFRFADGEVTEAQWHTATEWAARVAAGTTCPDSVAIAWPLVRTLLR